ncbi:hypothetical protein FHX37_3437 [Haloactinospora alba]|uniref:Uncharacterized protein n=1 Tax=Haloactinospora alba TaxID=405555 RepID=A0A543NNK9_9ACTN|nr:hypothetical protein FHX37_3437 [Haloactinospora alba]
MFATSVLATESESGLPHAFRHDGRQHAAPLLSAPFRGPSAALLPCIPHTAHPLAPGSARIGERAGTTPTGVRGSNEKELA